MADDVTFIGPLFDNRLASIMGNLDVAINEAVAQRGVNLVKKRLGSVLKHPTGKYSSRIQTERVSTERMVTDGKMVYGPWLEGTGSRSRSTRFKGYRTFRLATQELDSKAEGIAEDVVARFIGRLS